MRGEGQVVLGWGDVPTPLKLLGACIIVGSGLFIFYRERQLALRGRHGLALHMVAEGQAPPGAQQRGTALQHGRTPRHVAPHIEAQDDVKARRRQGNGM